MIKMEAKSEIAEADTEHEECGNGNSFEIVYCFTRRQKPVLKSRVIGAAENYSINEK